jgi:hypothetical protein
VGSSYELDAAPKAVSYIIFLFCIIWRLLLEGSKPSKVKFILINQKKTNQEVIFAGKVSKTKQ